MRPRMGRRIAAALMALLPLAACVDSPVEVEANAPLADNNQLAVNFEQIADEQAAAGDTERAEEFRWAALALRHGLVPVPFEVENAGQTEIYHAFVHSARWAALAQATRPATHRALIAWRVTDSRMQVIMIGMHTDSATVQHPYSMRTLPGQLTSTLPAAHAIYLERGPNRGVWIGTEGWAKVALVSTGRPCPVPDGVDRPHGVACETADYLVKFDIGFARTRSFLSRLFDAVPPRRQIQAREQAVDGVIQTFTCIAPRSDTGC
ncbi:MAG TPA: hypothetical protein VF178_12250 [Gemmatimonadaceae bacterium]